MHREKGKTVLTTESDAPALIALKPWAGPRQDKYPL